MSVPDTLTELLQDPQHISAVRQALGISQAELGRLAGVSGGLVSKIENGSRRLTDDVAPRLWSVMFVADHNRRNYRRPPILEEIEVRSFDAIGVQQ